MLCIAEAADVASLQVVMLQRFEHGVFITMVVTIGCGYATASATMPC
jgi:hypothetical protein